MSNYGGQIKTKAAVAPSVEWLTHQQQQTDSRQIIPHNYFSIF